MKNNTMFQITQEEKNRITEMARELANNIESGETAQNAMVKFYMAQTGSSEEDARIFVTEKIIANVDLYNKSCREAIDLGNEEWVKEKIRCRVEGMSKEEEYFYKINLLIAIDSLDASILEAQIDADKDQMFESLKDKVPEMAKEGSVSDEDLNEVNELLEVAISKSAITLNICSEFEALVEGSADEESVKAFVTGMWEDETLKYYMALSACVAKEKGELPSVPEDTPVETLVYGVCQGIDVAQVEYKVSIGEMVWDVATKILKVIGAVALTLVAVNLMCLVAKVVSGVTFAAATAILGNGVLAVAIGAIIGISLMWKIGSDFGVWFEKLGTGLGKIYDFTMSAIKNTAKKITSFVKDTVVPKTKEYASRAWSFIKSKIHWKSKNTATVNATV